MASKSLFVVLLLLIDIYSVHSSTGHRGYSLDVFVEAPECNKHCKAKEYRKEQMEWCCWGTGHSRTAICECDTTDSSNCTVRCLKKKN